MRKIRSSRSTGSARRGAVLFLLVMGVLFSAFSAVADQKAEQAVSLSRLSDLLADQLKPTIGTNQSLLTGMVVFRQTDAVYLDLAKGSGVLLGQTFVIERPGEQILHPVTKEVLGTAQTTVGTVQIDWIDEKFSRAKILSENPNSPIEVRDSARAQESILFFVSAAPHAEDGRRSGLSLAVEKAMAESVLKLSSGYKLTGTEANRYGLGRSLTDLQARQVASSYKANYLLSGLLEEQKDSVRLTITLLDGATGLPKGEPIHFLIEKDKEMLGLLSQGIETGRNGATSASSQQPMSSSPKEGEAGSSSSVTPQPQSPPAPAPPSAPTNPSRKKDKEGGLNPVTYKEDGGQIIESLPIPAIDMAIADLDGDGLNEMVLIEPRRLMICRWDSYGLRTVWEQAGDLGLNYVDIDAADVNGDGHAEILLCNAPGSSIETKVLSWGGSGSPTELWKGNGWLLRALHGQDGKTHVYAQSIGYRDPFQQGIMELTWQGKEFASSKVSGLPTALTLYDFILLNDGRTISIDFDKNLRLYGTNGKALWKSEQKDYGGTFVEIVSKDGHKRQEKREGIVGFNMDATGPDEVIVIQNLEARNRVLSWFQFGEKTRYAKGRVVAFALEGNTLVERWSTKEYDGFFTHIEAADANNDGMVDLAALQMSGESAIIRLVPLK